MNTWSKKHGFGNKGTHDSAMTFAEQMLSGKPVRRASRRDRLPKLKPRAKPQFGRKVSHQSHDDRGLFGGYFMAGVVACGFCVAVVAQIIVAS